MTVADLIAALQGMPQDAEVYAVDNDEYSPDFFRPASISVLAKDVVTHPRWPHAKADIVVIA